MKVDSCLVAVTGGGGFIGSHLVETLVRRGCRVIVFDSFEKGKLSNLPSNDERITIKNVNLTSNIEGWKEDLKGADYLFDLAAKSPGNRDLYRNPADLVRTNVAITLNVARAAASASIQRIIFVSSSCVYDHKHARVPHKESDVNLPESHYGWSKLFGEEIYSAQAEQSGLSIGIGRIFNAYGPRESLGSPHVITEFITKAFGCARGNRTFEILGDGNQTRTFLFVSDAVEGLIKLAESDASTPINLGSVREIAINELAKLILHEAGIDAATVAFIHNPTDPRDIRRRAPDISKAKDTLGWEPKVDLEAGLRATTTWWQNLIARKGDVSS